MPSVKFAVLKTTRPGANDPLYFPSTRNLSHHAPAHPSLVSMETLPEIVAPSSGVRIDIQGVGVGLGVVAAAEGAREASKNKIVA